MVLINKLTIDDINAALIHLQRSQGEVVGGVKSDTPIQNITIQNSGGGTGTNYDSVIHIIQERLKAHDTAITEDEVRLTVAESENATQTEQISAIFELLSELSDNGVQSLQFDATSRYLILYTQDGNTYDVEIPSETVSLSFDSTTNKLIFEMGSQTQEVTLPYINTSQMGVAGGVATLDENGRVPYSQLPESAMEFKGEWNASTNTPTLADGTGTNGDFYICNAGGTVNFGTQAEPRLVTFAINDRVIYEGDVDEWKRLPAGQVSSVNGQSGVVELDAADIPYDSTLSVKDKLDSATQSDWTQTDSTQPDFIKHKIPIWITQGSADDNMSPIDSVTDGSMRPVTSNAVAQKGYLTSADITNQVTVDNMQSVSSNAVSNAISIMQTEHQVGYWQGRPMFEKLVGVEIPSYSTTMYNYALSTGVNDILTVVDFQGIYVKGAYNNPAFIMHVPYTFIDPTTNTWLNIYVYYNPANKSFQISMGGTYSNGYYSNGYLYISFRYIKQA